MDEEKREQLTVNRNGSARAIRGIETVYAGIKFRSRAEARWAAFFDNCGWRWRYEPIDLEGYIPDFIIGFAKPTIVEIKGHALCVEQLRDSMPKLEATSWEGDAIVLGANPLWDDPKALNPIIGIISERDGMGWNWGDCLVHRCAICTKISVHHDHGSWRCRVSGCYEGNRYIGGIEAAELNERWARASNTTRWESP